MNKSPPKKRIYRNSGFAGEMLVAAELARLGYEVLLGNVGTKRTIAVDLAAVDPATGRTVSISVKSVKQSNSFLVDPEQVRPEAVYIFVITNEAGKLPRFFVVTGADLLANEHALWGKYGRTYDPKHGRGIRPNALAQWESDWSVLDR